jgi:hypothetical protein
VALATLRRYLHAWALEGPTRASRYLVAAQRVRGDRGATLLASGTVESHRLYRWSRGSRFTLLVTMDLHFASNPMAWNRGLNTRFVTVHLRHHPRRYLLELATGP